MLHPRGFTIWEIWVKAFKSGPSKVCGRQPLKNFTQSIIEYFAPYMDWHKEVASTTIKLILTLLDFSITVIWFTFLSNKKKFCVWSCAFNSILLYKCSPDYLFQAKVLSLKIYVFIFFLIWFFYFVRVFVVVFFSHICFVSSHIHTPTVTISASLS